MKILLLNPFVTLNENRRAYPMEPLGLLSLATYLASTVDVAAERIEIALLDAAMEGGSVPLRTVRGYRCGMSDAEVERRLRDLRPDVVGITNNYTNALGDVLDMVDLVRRCCPSCFLVLGGAHATMDHRNLMQRAGIDAVVRGEGEETFRELVIALRNGRSPAGVPGLTVRDQGAIRHGADRPLLADLDALPIPDRSFVDYRAYLRATADTYFNTRNRPVGTIISSRGCPYRCVFCSTHTMWGHQWRPRSASRVMEEIEYLHDAYGVREIAFLDDQFMGDGERIRELCRLLMASRLGVSLICPAGISPALIDPPTIALMRRAGFYRLCFSVDVGTDASRRFARKPVRLEDVRPLVAAANRAGFWTYATFVLGFPDEREADIRETIRYAYGLKLDYVRFYVAHPHLGSELYELYLDDHRITRGMVESHRWYDQPVVGTRYVERHRLGQLRDDAERGYLRVHLRHLLNPVYAAREFLPKISSARDMRYFLRLIMTHRRIRSMQFN